MRRRYQHRVSYPSSVYTTRCSAVTVSEADMRVCAGVRSSWRDDFRTKMLKLYVCNQGPLFHSTLGVCSRFRTSTSLPLLAPLFLLPPLLLESPLFVVLAHPDTHCRRRILLPGSSLHFRVGSSGSIVEEAPAPSQRLLHLPSRTKAVQLNHSYQ